MYFYNLIIYYKMSGNLHGVMHVLDSVSNKPRPLVLAGNTLAVDNSNQTQPVSVASLPLPTGGATAALQTSGNSDLSTIAGSVALNATAMGQNTGNSSLSNIESSLAGTLSVTQSVSKASTTVSSAASVAAGDYSSVHDASDHRKIAIFGTTTDTSNNIDVYVSDDNSTFYKFGNFSIYPSYSGDFSMLMDCPFKYIKLGYNGSATVTSLICGSN